MHSVEKQRKIQRRIHWGIGVGGARGRNKGNGFLDFTVIERSDANFESPDCRIDQNAHKMLKLRRKLAQMKMLSDPLGFGSDRFSS